jgi:membrane-associated protein
MKDSVPDSKTRRARNQRMEPGNFTVYNVVGGVLWIVSLTLAGFFFGNIPIVKNNLTLVIFAIIFLSILPGIVEYVRHKAQA